MRVVIGFIIALFIFSPFALSMQRLSKMPYCSAPKRFGVQCRAMSFIKTGPSSSLIENIRREGNRQVPGEFFNQDQSIKEILKVIKNDLYVTGNYPHVDPTTGQPGYCQLIAGFLSSQISKLNTLNLENDGDDSMRCFLPLVKAYILQEQYCPKSYDAKMAWAGHGVFSVIIIKLLVVNCSHAAQSEFSQVKKRITKTK